MPENEISALFTFVRVPLVVVVLLKKLLEDNFNVH